MHLFYHYASTFNTLKNKYSYILSLELIYGYVSMLSTCYRKFNTWYHAMRVNILCCTRYLPDPGHVMLDIRFMTMIYGNYTDTWHVTLDIWFLTPVLDMSYLTPALDTRYMLCFHVVQIPGPDIVTLDRTLWYLYYMTYSWLSLLRGLGMTIILLPDIWYSWTSVLLYSWTPEIWRLLTLVLMLYSCWSP